MLTHGRRMNYAVRHRPEISRRGVKTYSMMSLEVTRPRPESLCLVTVTWTRYEFFLCTWYVRSSTPFASSDFHTHMLCSMTRAIIHCKYYVMLSQGFDFVVYPPEHAVSFVGMFWWIHYQDETLHALRNVDSIRLQPRRSMNLSKKNIILSFEYPG
jgi:hypothetical protein